MMTTNWSPLTDEFGGVRTLETNSRGTEISNIVMLLTWHYTRNNGPVQWKANECQ